MALLFSRRVRVFFVVLSVAVMTAACGHKGSSLSPDPSPTPTPGAAADAEVIITKKFTSGSCANTPQWSKVRAALGTVHWPGDYNQTGLNMKPVGVQSDGSGGSWTTTIKVPSSVQSDGTVEGWEFEIADRCAYNGSGALSDGGITIQVKGCSGNPVPLPDMGSQPTALYLVTPCGVGATAEQAQATAGK